MKKIFGKEFIIGLSVLAAIAILIVGIEYLKGINMFSPANFYYVNYDNVSGLEVSSPVTIDGYKVGQVREISYDFENPGKIKVLLAVNKQLRVPEDSYAELSSTLMNGGYVNIKMGKSKTLLPVGSTLRSRANPDLMQAVSNEIIPTVNTILPRVDTLLMNLNTLAANPAISQSISRLDGISGNLLLASGGLKTVMSRDVPYVMNNTKSITTRIDSISSNLAVLSYQLKQLPLQTTMENVNQITANLERFSAQLNNRNSTLGKITTDDELYNRLNRVTADIDSLIIDIKKNPKRYISIKLL
ncbi:MAG: MlaD family protein [Candidatus Amulumruptor caecigallinarius]|nr:MlaD family protein [Candidatus Amulumruptor caecigallinarius]